MSEDLFFYVGHVFTVVLALFATYMCYRTWESTSSFVKEIGVNDPILRRSPLIFLVLGITIAVDIGLHVYDLYYIEAIDRYVDHRFLIRHWYASIQLGEVLTFIVVSCCSTITNYCLRLYGNNMVSLAKLVGQLNGNKVDLQTLLERSTD